MSWPWLCSALHSQKECGVCLTARCAACMVWVLARLGCCCAGWVTQTVLRSARHTAELVRGGLRDLPLVRDSLLLTALPPPLCVHTTWLP